jgi:hypothetical protein
MKKIITIAVSAFLFAILVLNSINISQQGAIRDISLKNISLMAQANAEDPYIPCVSCGCGCYFNHVFYACFRDTR